MTGRPEHCSNGQPEGQPVRLRAVAIGSLARVDKKNADIEAKLLAYLNGSSFDIRFAALSARGKQGDPQQSPRSRLCSMATI